MGEGSLQFYLGQKKDTTKSKSKPPSVGGTDVAQFPSVLDGLSGNAENQVNCSFASLDLTASLDPWPPGLAVTFLSCLPSPDAHLSFFFSACSVPFPILLDLVSKGSLCLCPWQGGGAG